MEQEIQRVVSQSIADWLNNGKNRGLSHIVKRSGLSYSTVRRLLEKETRPQQETVIAALSAIMSLQDVYDLLSPFYPKLKDLTEFQSSKYDFIELNDEIDWQGIDPWLVALAASGKGVTREYLSRMFGKVCEERIDRFLTVGLFKEINGRIKTASDNYTDPSASSVFQKIRLFVGNYKLSNVGNGAFYKYRTYAVSDSQAERIMEIRRREEKAIEAILAEETAQASKVHISVSMSNYIEIEDRK